MAKRILVLSVLALTCLTVAMGSIQKNCDFDKNRDEGEPQLAINGLDPVLLVAGKEVTGKEDYTAVHAGFLYHFANRDNRSAFVSDPESYGVQMHTFCPIRHDLPGRANIFIVHEGRIYLFNSEQCLDSFHDQMTNWVPL